MKSTISDSRAAYDFIAGTLMNEEQEHLFAITLNNANCVKSVHFIGLGSENAVCISPKLIARAAILDLASSVILVHNHPSGNSEPSSADINETTKVRKTLEIMDVRLLDHIVIGDNEYYSFADNKKTILSK